MACRPLGSKACRFRTLSRLVTGCLLEDSVWVSARSGSYEIKYWEYRMLIMSGRVGVKMGGGPDVTSNKGEVVKIAQLEPHSKSTKLSTLVPRPEGGPYDVVRPNPPQLPRRLTRTIYRYNTRIVHWQTPNGKGQCATIVTCLCNGYTPVT